MQPTNHARKRFVRVILRGMVEGMEKNNKNHILHVLPKTNNLIGRIVERATYKKLETDNQWGPKNSVANIIRMWRIGSGKDARICRTALLTRHDLPPITWG